MMLLISLDSAVPTSWMLWRHAECTVNARETGCRTEYADTPPEGVIVLGRLGMVEVPFNTGVGFARLFPTFLDAMAISSTRCGIACWERTTCQRASYNIKYMLKLPVAVVKGRKNVRYWVANVKIMIMFRKRFKQKNISNNARWVNVRRAKGVWCWRVNHALREEQYV
jgi:hypothetical protein